MELENLNQENLTSVPNQSENDNKNSSLMCKTAATTSNDFNLESG